MNTQIKQFFLFSFLLISTLVSAQKNNSEKQDYSLPDGKFNTQFKFKRLFSREYYGFYYYFGYHQTSFINPMYGLNHKEGDIRYKIGTEFTAYYATIRFVHDFSWFASRYYVEPQAVGLLMSASEYDKVLNRGVSLGTQYLLIPSTDFFQPFVGLSVASSSLIAKKKDPNQGEDDYPSYQKVASVNTSAVFFRTGFYMAFGGYHTKRYNFKFEYKRSLYAANELQMGQICVGLALKME